MYESVSAIYQRTKSSTLRLMLIFGLLGFSHAALASFTDSITIHSMLPYHVLLQLVQDYCNMYPLSRTEEDQLSSLFKISPKAQGIYNLAYLDRKKIG